MAFKALILKALSIMTLFEERDGQVRTKSNRSGGVQGGISNEKNCIFGSSLTHATVLQKQKTVDEQGQNTELMGRGRHDPCVH